jgi:hypothetical protein
MLVGLSVLLWPLVLVLLALGLVRRRQTLTGSASWGLGLPPGDTLAEVFLVIAVGFVGMALVGFNRDLGLGFEWRALLLIASLVALLTAYVFDVGWPLLLGLVGTSGWWGAQAQQWIADSHVRAATLITGLGLLALLFVTLGALEARATGARPRAGAYAVSGLAGVVGTTFMLSTTNGLTELERGLRGQPPWTSPPLALSLAVIAGGLVLVLLLAAGLRALGGLEMVALVVHAALFAALTVVPPESLIVPSPARRMWIPAGPDFTDVGMAVAAGCNVLLFLQLVGIMVIGHTRHQAWLVNCGALFLLMAVVAKYFDWFFAFLNKSLFFLGAGAILLVVGWLLEISRRRMVAAWR